MGKIIAICGGTCSGKSTFASQAPGAIVIATDDYYRDGMMNVDDPTSVDLEACAQACQKLALGEAVDIPMYLKVTYSRTGYQLIQAPASGLIIVEGIFAFEPSIRAVANSLIFLDVDLEERKKRRFERDTTLGKSMDDIIHNLSNVELAEKEHLNRLRELADIVLSESAMKDYWLTLQAS
jgi:uridine kinase